METQREIEIKEIRHKIASLPADERKKLASEGAKRWDGTSMSPYNTLMIYYQSGGTATMVGGYRQWQKANRQVKKGTHGMTILFPVGAKDKDGMITDVERFFCGTVFDIAQTEEAQNVNV